MIPQAIAQPKISLPAPTGVPCPMLQFVDLVAGKWAIPVLYRLIVISDPIRFGELQRGVRPITQKELTRQLRAFERKGLVRRTQFAEIPPRVEYQVTELGRSLHAPLQSLAQWVMDHQECLGA